jgi:large subunit ribosomal protein L7/L12
MISQEQVVSYIADARLGTLKQLITALEDELGVSVGAPGLVVPPPPPEPTPERTEVDLVLTGFTGKKVDVIKAVRKLTGLGLREARAVVEGAPTVLREAVSLQTAEELATELRAASATVEVR